MVSILEGLINIFFKFIRRMLDEKLLDNWARHIGLVYFSHLLVMMPSMALCMCVNSCWFKGPRSSSFGL